MTQTGTSARIGRKIALAVAITVGFFVALEGLLWLVGVRPVLYDRDPYVGFAATSPLFVPSPTGADLVTADNKLSLFNRQRFARDKPATTFRIFCVGGSTTFGRPYDDTTSFCGWLRELLPVADPSIRWEVVNAGGVSYASYRVALLMEELIDYQPDLFVVYSGHNEFLERRSYPQIIAMPRAVRGIGAVAARTRTWSAMASVIDTVAGRTTAPVSDPEILDAEVTTLLDSAVGPEAYTRDDGLRAKVLDHYRFNLARMVDIARSAGARALFVTPASNLASSRPFKSEPGPHLSDDARRRFSQAVARGRALHGEGDLESAIAAAGEAATIDPRHAQLAYLQGRLLAEAGRWSEARRAFERARDEDICPLRAPGTVPAIVREVAADRRAAVVDFAALADGWAEHGVPGADLFLDHVHPRIEIHRRLAVSIIDEMAGAGMLQPGPQWGPAAVEEVARRVEDGLDPQSHALALMKLSKVLGWAGQRRDADRLAQQAVRLFPDDSRVQYNAGLNAQLNGRNRDAAAHYLRAIELQPDADLPHGNLGVLLEEAGQLEAAIHHYREAIRYARTDETRRRNQANLERALATAGRAN